MAIGCNSFRQMDRRQFLRIGGATLCGVNLLDILRARSAGIPLTPGPSPARREVRNTRPKQMICIWMAGGPPHTDMFDMKPNSPVDYRGEFRPMRSNLPGLDVCELMPRLAQQANKYT